MGPLLIPLLAAGASAIGSGVGAYQKNQAKKDRNAWYDYAEGFANTQRNLSTFDTPGGKALLKISDRNNLKELAALNNRAVAGGATMENQLAARQALNENRDKVNMQVLQADQKRKDAWDNQLLDLKGQRAMANVNDRLQAAQDWNQWGGQMASSLMSLGSAGLLGGAGSITDAASAVSAGALPVGAGVAGSSYEVFNNAVNASRTPSIKLGGLAAPKYAEA